MGVHLLGVLVIRAKARANLAQNYLRTSKYLDMVLYGLINIYLRVGKRVVIETWVPIWGLPIGDIEGARFSTPRTLHLFPGGLRTRHKLLSLQWFKKAFKVLSVQLQYFFGSCHESRVGSASKECVPPDSLWLAKKTARELPGRACHSHPCPWTRRGWSFLLSAAQDSGYQDLDAGRSEVMASQGYPGVSGPRSLGLESKIVTLLPLCFYATRAHHVSIKALSTHGRLQQPGELQNNTQQFLMESIGQVRRTRTGIMFSRKPHGKKN